MRHLFVCALLLTSSSASFACSPAPSCWISEYGPKSAYLKGICRNYVKNNQTASNIKQIVDEPDQVPKFVNACKALGINIKD